MAERAMRPFWIHQLVEYLIGIALIAQGFQDPEPLVPVAVGVVVLVSAAIVRGPFGAYRLVSRGTHRWIDLAVMVGISVAAVQPWVAVDSGGRLVLGAILLPFGFLWFYTDWDERRERADRRTRRGGATSAGIGRRAGRLAGSAWVAGKRAVDQRSDP